jgi:hypothetical protein
LDVQLAIEMDDVTAILAIEFNSADGTVQSTTLFLEDRITKRRAHACLGRKFHPFFFFLVSPLARKGIRDVRMDFVQEHPG